MTVAQQQPSSSPQAASIPMSAAAWLRAFPFPISPRASDHARRTPALSRHYRAGAADGRAIRAAAC